MIEPTGTPSLDETVYPPQSEPLTTPAATDMSTDLGPPQEPTADTSPCGSETGQPKNEGTPVVDRDRPPSRRDYLPDVPVLGYAQASSQQSPIDRRDPTELYRPFKPSSQVWSKYQHIEAKVPGYANQLKEEGVLVISCAHEVLLQTAAFLVLDHDRLEGLVRRTMDLDLYNEEGVLAMLVTDSCLSCIGETVPGKNDGGRNSIVVIDLWEKGSTDLFERYTRRLSRHRPSRERDLYYLFRISGPALTTVSNHSWHSTIPWWHIDPLSEMFAGQEGDAASIMKALLQSRDAGFWSKEEGEFLRDVEGVLGNGSLNTLKQEIENRQSVKSDENPLVKAKALLRGANIVEKAALFTAVFFSECTIHQFSKIVGQLVEGESVEHVHQEDFVQPETGQVLTRNLRSRVEAKDWWIRRQEDSDIIERLGLEEFADRDEGKTVMRFAHPAMKMGVRNAFQSMLLIRFFESLHAAGVLLDPSTPKLIVDALVDLTTEMSVLHRDAYNETWLMAKLVETMGHIQDYADQAGQVLNDMGQKSGDFADLLRFLHKEWRSYHSLLFNRLTRLCRGFLDNDRTIRITHSFLDQLIARTQPHGMEALEIINRLRVVKGFDHLSRLRHLLEVGNKETCQQVVRILLTEMEDSPDAYWTVLQRVAEWHPSQDIVQKGKQLSKSQYWSLAFLFIVYDIKRGLAAEHRDRHSDLQISLFAQHDELPPLDERLQLIANWLGHPAFPQTVATMLKKDNPDMYAIVSAWAGEEGKVGAFCMAEMLEFWNWESNDEIVSKLVPLLANRLPRASLTCLRLFIRQHLYWLTDGVRDAAKRSELNSRRRKADMLSQSLVPQGS